MGRRHGTTADRLLARANRLARTRRHGARRGTLSHGRGRTGLLGGGRLCGCRHGLCGCSRSDRGGSLRSHGLRSSRSRRRLCGRSRRLRSRRCDLRLRGGRRFDGLRRNRHLGLDGRGSRRTGRHGRRGRCGRGRAGRRSGGNRGDLRRHGGCGGACRGCSRCGRSRRLGGRHDATLHLLDDHLLRTAVGKALPDRALLDRPLERQGGFGGHAQSLLANVVRFTHQSFVLRAVSVPQSCERRSRSSASVSLNLR